MPNKFSHESSDVTRSDAYELLHDDSYSDELLYGSNNESDQEVLFLNVVGYFTDQLTDSAHRAEQQVDEILENPGRFMKKIIVVPVVIAGLAILPRVVQKIKKG